MTEFRIYREDGKERLQFRTRNEGYKLAGAIGASVAGGSNWSDWTDVPVVEATAIKRYRWVVWADSNKSERVFVTKDRLTKEEVDARFLSAFVVGRLEDTEIV